MKQGKRSAMKLENRTILITGGSGGIGFELAAQLLRRGNTVIVTGRDQRALDAAQQKLPGLHAIRSDVADPPAIEALHRRVLAEFPQLDVLINNAGIMRKLNLQTFGTDLTDLTREIDINLSGTIRMVLQFLPHLVSREHALIVNVSSGLAFVPYPIAPIYAATKAGVHSFTQSLRVQLRETQVKVVEIAPPAVDTPLNDVFAAELKGSPVMNVVELVERAIKGVENDRVEVRVGLANILRLMSRVAPGFILKQLSKPVEAMLAQMKQPKQLGSS
jgi:uncharacterized oxidoreductase